MLDPTHQIPINFDVEMNALKKKRSSFGLRMRSVFSSKLSTHAEYIEEVTPPPPPIQDPPFPELRGSSIFGPARLTKHRRVPSESYQQTYHQHPAQDKKRDMKLKVGDTPPSRAKNQKITPREIRELRELIRYRYSLDVEIWSLRDVDTWDRDAVIERQNRSDAALGRIKAIANQWDKREYFNTDREYQRMQDIRFRCFLSGKRNWAREPAWLEAESM